VRRRGVERGCRIHVTQVAYAEGFVVRQRRSGSHKFTANAIRAGLIKGFRNELWNVMQTNDCGRGATILFQT
jgi:hypothetical protein